MRRLVYLLLALLPAVVGSLVLFDLTVEIANISVRLLSGSTL
jgi:hypothetical protein